MSSLGGHSHSHNHHGEEKEEEDCAATTTDHHAHDEHSHVVHQSRADTRVKDIALWSSSDDNDNKDEQRLSKSYGLLDHAHDTNDQVLLKLQRAALLCLTFLCVEVVGGYLAGSLAVLSDASHLCADLASFAVAIGASYLASLPKTANHTFGLKRVESLAALLSMLSLAFISIALGVEALRRIYKITMTTDGATVEVQGVLMSGIAFIGVLVNIALAFVLGEHHVHMPSDSGCGSHNHSHGHSSHEAAVSGDKNHGKESSCTAGGDDHGHSHGHSHGHEADEATPLVNKTSNNNDKEEKGGHEHVHEHHDESAKNDDHPGVPIPFLPKNINLQAAYLHVLGDLAQSVAVLIAGLLIWAFPSWTIVDPICTLLFCTIVGYSTVGVLRSSVAVLLQEVPPSVDWKSVFDAIENIPGVSDVHDLHIWSISHGIPALSVHCKAEEPELALEHIYTRCRDFGIVHATIQVQSQSGECVTCTDRICRLCQFAEERQATRTMTKTNITANNGNDNGGTMV
uniref:Cation efflux protein cytoplasmic domain-containing protein n=1 Tax=Amphora coffeiformis TaxID=265554 RepID=A0A7S3L9L2_9STRA